MNNIATITARFVAAALVCAALSACTSPVASTGNFPVYGSQAAAAPGSYSAESIMDY